MMHRLSRALVAALFVGLSSAPLVACSGAPEATPAVSAGPVLQIATVDGKTFDGMIDGITSGDAHKLVVGSPGYVEQSIGFQGNPMETKRFDVLLEKAPVAVTAKPTASATGAATAPPPPPPPTQPQGNGKLNVAASGGWCNVAVDGAPRGATPVAGIELSAGTHRITCTTQDGKTMNASVNVPVDGVARYKFSL